MKDKKTKIFKKVLVAILIATVLLVQSPFGLVLAQTAPTSPTSPNEPTSPSTPSSPTSPSQPTPAEEPSLPSEPTSEETPTPTPTPNDHSHDGSGTSIITGDADNVGNIATTGNINTSANPVLLDDSGNGIKVVNSENGSDSNNTGSVDVVDNNNTNQTNSAGVTNSLYQSTTTGKNSASENTGSDSSIVTGSANTTGTLLTSLNTNLSGVAVYEFNLVDDQVGDYVLDLQKATCVSGCPGGNALVSNIGNGSDSTNTGQVGVIENNNTFQANDASIENNLVLASDSGHNEADKNTGGDSSIVTGDANVSANALTFVNNNIEGGVVYTVVNIFGDLIGDIILPDGTVLSCCAGNISVANTGNGANSTNTSTVEAATNSNFDQFNNANIENNLILEAVTGDNDVSKNTTGASSVQTGDADIVAQVTNIANLNLVGGNYWLVIINETGKWIGKIIGADGSYWGGSEIFEFNVDKSGEINVTNSGNGTGSTNTGVVNQETNTNISQNNNANIVNNIDLSANSGKNSASKNTGGSSTIQTGDANIVANIVNFVNNNIIGTGRLFVTVVNVFGKWIGDFVGPGHLPAQAGAKEESTPSQPAVGGANVALSQSQNSSPEDNSTDFSESHSNPKQKISSKNFDESEIDSAHKENQNEVAGLTDESQGTNTLSTQAKKIVKINLAWLIFLIPFLLILPKGIRALKGRYAS
ncbi:hypothetical protein HY008_01605 [Candidatus Woesebacteria bacterium]|nr:hypothetical protein [Candidatus Woesebacteria bacterium]